MTHTSQKGYETVRHFGDVFWIWRLFVKYFIEFGDQFTIKAIFKLSHGFQFGAMFLGHFGELLFMLLSLSLDNGKFFLVPLLIIKNFLGGTINLLILLFHVLQSSLKLLRKFGMLLIDLSLCDTVCIKNLFTCGGLLNKV